MTYVSHVLNANVNTVFVMEMYLTYNFTFRKMVIAHTKVYVMSYGCTCTKYKKWFISPLREMFQL